MQLNFNEANDLCYSLKERNICCKYFYQIYLGEFYENIDFWKANIFLEKNIKKEINNNFDYINLNAITYL